MKPGFTIAEVLITLGIVGITAALTLPAIINNTQNKQLETALKKAYSTINQALLLYENENGQPITPTATRHSVKPALMKYIKTVKDCGTGSTGEVAKACVPNNSFVENPDEEKDVYKTYNGDYSITLSAFDDGQFIMNDGMLVLIENSGSISYQCVWISVDVNGYNKRPNRLGKDLFMFQISNSGQLLPMGAKGTNYYSETDEYCSENDIPMNGAGCTQKALTDPKFWKNLP